MAVDKNGVDLSLPWADKSGSMFSDLLGAVTPAIGDVLNSKNLSGQKNAVNNAVGAYANLPVPTANQLTYQATPTEYQGGYNPVNGTAAQQTSDAYANLSTDPVTRAAQMSALAQYQNIANSGGLTDQDKAKLQQIQESNKTQEAGQRGAILQDAQSRGVGGAGSEMAAQLLNQQGGANRNNAQGTDVAGQASERALQALGSGASLASNINTSDWQQQAAKAAAANAINQFNTQNQQSTNTLNTNAANTAASQNATAKQAASNATAASQNTTNEFNANAPVKAFNAAATQASGLSGAYGNQAGYYGNQAQQNASKNDNIFGNLAKLGTDSGLFSSIGSSLFSDEEMKEDVKSFDPSEMLDKLAPVAYKYKKETGLEQTPQAGIMAQDLEKSEAGKELVENTPKGKTINGTKAIGPMFASLADMNKRVKKLEGEK